MTPLQLGDTGRNVEVWQRFLAQAWFAEYDTMMPGVFDEATEAATHAFQAQYAIEPTGQAEHVVAAVTGENVPTGHGWHGRSGNRANSPRTHGVHAVAPAALAAVPGAHAVHTA